MPRRDELDDDDDRPRSRRSRHDEEFPSRRRRMDDDDERPRRRKSEPKKSNAGVIVGIIVGVFVVFCGGGGLVIYWAVQGVKKGIDDIEKNMQAAMAEAEAEHSADNLEQIGKAIRKYESVQRFLPNNSYDDTGKPLLSWRVHILPFLGDDDSAELYRRFRLNEPWDSPHNRQVLNSSKMPFVYHHQFDFDNPGQTTFYRGFCHSGAVFEKPRDGKSAPQIGLASGIPDGLANTILVVEAGDAVEWTKPDDMDWSRNGARPNLGGVNPKRNFFVAVMADGSARKIRRDVKDDTLRLLIDRRDGTPIPAGWEHPEPVRRNDLDD